MGKIHRSFPILMIVLTLAASVAVVMPIKDRYLNVGTLEQFQSGQTTPLAQSAVGRVPGTLSAVLIPLGIVLLIWSRRQKFTSQV